MLEDRAGGRHLNNEQSLGLGRAGGLCFLGGREGLSFQIVSAALPLGLLSQAKT